MRLRCVNHLWSLTAAVSGQSRHQVGCEEATRVGQRCEADGATDGVSQQRLQDLHWWQVLIGRQDHSGYACAQAPGEMRWGIVPRGFLIVRVVPAACAAAWDVPLPEAKQVAQSLLALMMSSPGANTSTQRPTLVPPAPCAISWPAKFTAPTVITCTHKNG